MRPEIRREECYRPLEVGRVQEQRPAVVAGGNVLSISRRFGFCKWQRQVAVAEQFTGGALLEIKPIRREQQPRAELSDAVLPFGVVPISTLSRARSVGPFDEVRRDAAHDEFGSLGGKVSPPPPAQPAFDIGIEFLRSLALILGEHPCTKEARLEAMAGISL